MFKCHMLHTDNTERTSLSLITGMSLNEHRESSDLLTINQEYKTFYCQRISFGRQEFPNECITS